MLQVDVRVSFNGLSEARGSVDAAAAETMRVDMVKTVAVEASGGVRSLKAAVGGIPGVAHCLAELEKVGTGLQLTVISRGQAMLDHMLSSLRPGEVVYCVFTAARDGHRAPGDDEPRAARGFDRLLEANFTEEDVALMRTHFRRRSPGNASSAADLELEDAWLDNEAAASLPPAPRATNSGGVGLRSTSRSPAAEVLLPPHWARLDPVADLPSPSFEAHEDGDVEVEVDPVDPPYFVNYYTHFLVSWILGYFFGMIALAIDSRKSRMGSWLGILTNVVLGFCAASSVNVAKM
ncbi:hypothetical protein DIPPA_12137 [Diplonema papillatum]|nr:hypothetical protein DIPPA_12137 [Diplonema papillatum]